MNHDNGVLCANLPAGHADCCQAMHEVHGLLRQRGGLPAELIGGQLRVCRVGARSKSGRIDAFCWLEARIVHRRPDSVQPASEILPARIAHRTCQLKECWAGQTVGKSL